MDEQHEHEHWYNQEDDGLYRPNPARIYDYALGGFANFAADRAAFDALVDVYPDARLAPQANRAFPRHVVTFLARQGIDRFLDVGSGLPTVSNVHEVAQRVHPKARVVYADNDPVAAGYGRDLLARDGATGVAVIEAGLRAPAAILSQRATRLLLVGGRPVALLLAVLPFVPDDDEARRSVRALTAALPAGSYLALSHGTADGVPADTLAQFVRLYERTTSPLGFRPRATIEDFFAGFELVEPGLAFVPAWRPDDPHAPFHDEPERRPSSGPSAASCSPRPTDRPRAASRSPLSRARRAGVCRPPTIPRGACRATPPRKADTRPQGRKGLFLASGPWTGEASGCSVTAETGGVSRQGRRKAGVPVAEHTDPTPATGAPTMTTEVLAAIVAEEPHGATADQVARTIGRGLDGTIVQEALDELVARGLLDRRRLGRGAVYTLSMMV